MPKTKAQNIIFTILMAFAMVYAMICYNIAVNRGGMTNEVFLLAFHELVIMWPLAFILEFFAGPFVRLVFRSLFKKQLGICEPQPGPEC